MLAITETPGSARLKPSELICSMALIEGVWYTLLNLRRPFPHQTTFPLYATVRRIAT